MQAGFLKPLLRSEFISENYQNLAHLQIVDQAPPAAGCESWLAGQYADARRRPSCGGTHDDGWSRIRLDLRPCIDVLFHSENARGTCVLCVLCVPSSGMWRAACLSEQTGKTTTCSAGVLSCGILCVTRRYLCSIPLDDELSLVEWRCNCLSGHDGASVQSIARQWSSGEWSLR